MKSETCLDHGTEWAVYCHNCSEWICFECDDKGDEECDSE